MTEETANYRPTIKDLVARLHVGHIQAGCPDFSGDGVALGLLALHSFTCDVFRPAGSPESAALALRLTLEIAESIAPGALAEYALKKGVTAATYLEDLPHLGAPDQVIRKSLLELHRFWLTIPKSYSSGQMYLPMIADLYRVACSFRYVLGYESTNIMLDNADFYSSRLRRLTDRDSL